METQQQFEKVMEECRALFVKKLHDYGAAWRILRPSSLTDQIYIKANRIRSIETKGVSFIDEGIRPEFIGIVNYAIIGLIQLEKGYSEKPDDMTKDEAIAAYDKHAQQTLQLMLRKNHDYGEAWRDMFATSLTDIILTKINRNKSITANDNQTLISEGADGNYFDMLNYAVFYLIKIIENETN